MEKDKDTEPTTSIEEMTVFLASDVGIDPRNVIAWHISLVVQTDVPEVLAMVNRFKDRNPDPMIVLGQIQAMCQAITGGQP